MFRRARIDDLIASYPRCRPPLSAAHRESYIEHYRGNRSGERGLSKTVLKLEAWMHRRVAEGVSGSILELGAGNLNHVPYHPEASVYDIVEPFRELWLDSAYRGSVRSIYQDLSHVPRTERYDCILSIAVLEHLTELPYILGSAAQLLSTNGSFRAGFPSEGGILWGLAWRLTTGIEYRLRRRLDYGAIMRHEHINTGAEVEALVRHLYESVEVSRFPLRGRHFSFYTVVVARRPRLDRCSALCEDASRTRGRPVERAVSL